MLENMNLLQRMEAKKSNFSKGQKKLAAFITEDFGRASVLTAQKMGEEAGVSESTVVRFAYQLEYDGYPEMQKALCVLVKTKSNTIDRLNLATKLSEKGDFLQYILQKDADRIRNSIAVIDREQFDRAVDLLDQAKHIYILGTKSASFIAGLMGYYLNIMMDNIHVIEANNIHDTFEQLYRIGQNDLFVGISFPRYSKRTVQALEFARRQGAETLAITDSDKSPITANADCVLTVNSDVIGIVDSLVAPQSLMNALVVAIANKRKDEVAKRLRTLEELWGKYEVYENNDEF